MGGDFTYCVQYRVHVFLILSLQGFYSVYGDLFSKIVQEETQFSDSDDDLPFLPPFGNYESQNFVRLSDKF